MKIFDRLLKLLLTLSSALYALPVHAQFVTDKVKDKIIGNTEVFAEEGAGFSGNLSVGGVVALVIQIMLSVLGVIFVSMIVYAGFLWMMARGNEEQARKAKDIIRHSIVGLIIVMSAYSITFFIVRFLALGIGTGDADVQIGIPSGA